VYNYKQILKYFEVRLGVISDINNDIAQVFFAAFAIESVTRDAINWNLVSLGLILSAIFWLAGIISYRIK
jgi:hypothetical protein